MYLALHLNRPALRLDPLSRPNLGANQQQQPICYSGLNLYDLHLSGSSNS